MQCTTQRNRNVQIELPLTFSSCNPTVWRFFSQHDYSILFFFQPGQTSTLSPLDPCDTPDAFFHSYEDCFDEVGTSNYGYGGEPLEGECGE